MQHESTLNQNAAELRTALSAVSHEIRNPLALINSELQLLSHHHPEVESYHEWDDILDNVEYIRELLNEFSNYANAWRLSKIPTDLSQFLYMVIKSFSPTLDYLGVSLKTDIPSCLPDLSIDQTKMRQALLNLLRNAQEALPLSGGEIFVQASPCGNGICISIRDNGCGITEEQQKTLFTPFITHKKGGTGLGLSITRQIIEAHGGSICVKSIPHQGTTVLVFLE